MASNSACNVLRTFAPLRSTRLLPQAHMRSLHLRPTSRLLQDQKDDTESRHDMNPTSTENTASGSDGDAAQESVAFDPKTTDPQDQHNKAGDKPGGNSQNPINASPANPNVNKAPEGAERNDGQSPAQAEGRRKISGGGSPQKNKGK